MGMFDNLHYQGNEYQTKDTPRQTLDNYKIEADQDSGHEYLWVEEYDAEWKEGGLLGGYLETKNKRWVCCHDFDGNIRFYRSIKDEVTGKRDKWEEFSALFMDGKLIKLKKVE
jgi:hypothetical protein